jgi:hypothetical protein
MPARKAAAKTSTSVAPVSVADTAPTTSVELEHDDMESICKPTYSSLTINEFVPDFVGKLPSVAAYIEVFLFVDKTRIKNTDTYCMFTFCPARINIIDKTRKAIGFMSTTKLQSLYGNDFKLRMFETQWSKLIQTVNINVINIELTPRTAKSGNTYYKTIIQSVPTTNTKVCDALQKLYDDTPTAIYEHSTEKLDDMGFADDVEEIA